MRLLIGTCRFEVHGKEEFEGARRDNPGCILAFWHQCLLVFSWTHRHQGIQVMVSQHADGDLIALPLQRLGFGTVRGSTTRGGPRALREMVRLARDGQDLGITPDGPRGPRYRVQPGVITLARLTGRPILFGTWAASRCWKLNSWDRFRIPKPFSRIVALYGEVFRVPRDITPEEEEEYRQRLEDFLVEKVRWVDERAAGGKP